MMLQFWSYSLAASADTQDPPLYRANLLSEMQDTLRALADINTRQEIEREQVRREDAQTITAAAA
jgi:hypothetical protein